MNTSELIAVAALVTSFIIGALNWLHTRRQLQVAHYPALQADIWYRHSGLAAVGEVIFVVRNVSSDRSAIDVKVKIEIAKRGVVSNFRTLLTRAVTVVPPSQSIDGRSENLADYIGREFPDVLTKRVRKRREVADAGEEDDDPGEEVTEDEEFDDEESYDWVIADRKPLKISLKIVYRPGVAGSKSIKIRKRYRLELIDRSRHGQEDHLVAFLLRDTEGNEWFVG